MTPMWIQAAAGRAAPHDCETKRELCAFTRVPAQQGGASLAQCLARAGHHLEEGGLHLGEYREGQGGYESPLQEYRGGG